jgi:hypothetical protein
MTALALWRGPPYPELDHPEPAPQVARLRARLADELGLDPGPDLRELEGPVLRQELTTPLPAPPPAPGFR